MDNHETNGGSRCDVFYRYAIFCGSKNPKNLLLYNFDGLTINSRQITTESKDDVFSSSFNTGKLYHICSNHKLTFAHNMYAIPGRKKVRIDGTLVTSTPQDTAIRISHKPPPAKEKSPEKALATISKEKEHASTSKGKERVTSENI